MRMRVSRRNVLGMLTGLFGTVIGVRHVRAEEASPAAACYWRIADSRCIGGVSFEKWCYRCCDVTGCEDKYCEWHDGGAC